MMFENLKPNNTTILSYLVILRAVDRVPEAPGKKVLYGRLGLLVLGPGAPYLFVPFCRPPWLSSSCQNDLYQHL